MKKNISFLLCMVLFLLVLPGLALAGDSCTAGVHDLDMVDVKYPTCETDGYMVLECKNCNYKKTEITDKAWGHDWKDDGVIYPDCENPGLEKMYCANCDKKWENVLSAIGHSWKDGEIFQDATCTMDGTRYEVCENCGKELLRTIAAKGHKWRNTLVIKEATCTKEGKAEAVCTECGEQSTRTLKKAPHTCTEWTVTKQATENAKGTRTSVCEVCGKKVTEAFDYVPGDIAIYTRTGKVNLRAGAGKNNKQMGQIEKKGTYLGKLYEAALDKNNDVWYKVKYEDRFRWVMAKYAEARVETDLAKERLPQSTGKELTNYLFKNNAAVLGILEDEKVPANQVVMPEWMNEAVYISGTPYVEQIALFGEGYSIYGVKTGDRIKDALKKLEKKNLVLVEDHDTQYIYRIPAWPDALSVDEDGFCGSLCVMVGSDNTVTEIRLYSDTTGYHFMNE